MASLRQTKPAIETLAVTALRRRLIGVPLVYTVMRRNSDDDEDPFGSSFGGIEDLLAGMAGGDDAPVDVHEYDDEIRVVAELPDVAADDVKIQCDGSTVAIYAAVTPRPVVTRVDLPSYVNDQSTEWSLNNGILEISLDRDTDPANIGFH